MQARSSSCAGTCPSGRARRLYLNSGTTLPFDADDWVDLVFCASMFTGGNLSYFYRYLQEFSRVLKPGGWCVFDYFDVASDAGWRGLTRNMRKQPIFAYAYHATHTIDRVMEDLGLQVVGRHATPRERVRQRPQALMDATRPAAPQSRPAVMPRLTVLVCTHNRAGLLVRMLKTLDQAARPPGWAIDVLVAANACSDDTHTRSWDAWRQQAASSGGLPLAWFAEPVPGRSNALNSALPRVESDMSPSSTTTIAWISGYLAAVCRAAAAHPAADLFCGRIRPTGTAASRPGCTTSARTVSTHCPCRDLTRATSPSRATPTGRSRRWQPVHSHAVGGRIGPFATAMGPTGHDLGGAEDLDWVLRGLRLGARLRYVPDMVQYHFVDPGRLTLG